MLLLLPPSRWERSKLEPAYDLCTHFNDVKSRTVVASVILSQCYIPSDR